MAKKRIKSRPHPFSPPPRLPPEVDHDFGVPIPGLPLPPEQWAQTGVKKLPEPQPVSGEFWFGRSARLILDLGCGNGRFVITEALRHPENDYIGLDSLPLVIRYATRRANQRGLSNVRMLVCGAYEFLEQYVVPASVAEIHLYHPQPYRDRRASDAYKRLVSPQFLNLVSDCLTEDGLFIVQTDNPAYWSYIRRVMPRFFYFTEQTGPWPDTPQGRTRREIYARQHGLTVFRAIGKPIRELSHDERAELIATLPLPEFDAELKKPKRHR